MPEEANSSSRYRILCTEDDPDTREVLRLLLELEGFVVTCAEDSDQALHFAKSEKFELFLLDSWLPGIDGEHLCQRLREFDSHAPILFYSGAATPADKARAMASGAQGYVVKPADPDDLVAEIGRLIRLGTK
jgi:two-component system alkaline phosphatase synthesis response regulator PhoP